MTALATWGTSGTSPGLARVLHQFDDYQFTSIKVEDPAEFEPLPARFTLIRRGGVWWLHDNHAPKSFMRGDR